MFNLTPTQYVEWLIATHGMTDDAACKKAEKLYRRQTGKRIRIFMKPYKDTMIWTYVEDQE